MFGTQTGAQVGEGNTGTYNIACLQRVDRMCNERATGDIEKYYIAFRYALFFVISAIPKDTRIAIIADFAKLEGAIKAISESEGNTQTKKAEIDGLKLGFAESHEYHIFEAFARVGILHISEEGVLDFTKRDIDKLKVATSGGSGVPAALRAASKEPEAGKDGVASGLP